MILQQAAGSRLELIGRTQLRTPFGEHALVLAYGRLWWFERSPGRGRRGHGQAASRAGSGDPLERVSTSKPVSFTSTVCSHCAERL